MSIASNAMRTVHTVHRAHTHATKSKSAENDIHSQTSKQLVCEFLKQNRSNECAHIETAMNTNNSKRRSEEGIKKLMSETRTKKAIQIQHLCTNTRPHALKDQHQQPHVIVQYSQRKSKKKSPFFHYLVFSFKACQLSQCLFHSIVLLQQFEIVNEPIVCQRYDVIVSQSLTLFDENISIFKTA